MLFMDLVAAIFLLFSLTSISYSSINAVNVLDHGAVGDGKTVENEAFLKAWVETCNNSESGELVIPANGKFLLQPILFSGPCKTIVKVKLLGELLAIDDPKKWKQVAREKWILYQHINGLTIHGNGRINGRGNHWWELSCKKNPKAGCLSTAPNALTFMGCNNVRVSDIASVDSPHFHISVYQSNSVNLDFLTITAPEDSPNTDGIHIEDAHHVTVNNSNIATGDDCVSVGDRTSNININHIHCGPGHGVSVGSLGKTGEKVNVVNITVTGINFYGTLNGARIKTWQVGSGRAEHIQFSHLNFSNVRNPIIIDQYYCDSSKPCTGTNTGVLLDDVRFSDAFGTSATKVAINLNCSKIVPCTNIVLDTIKLTSAIPGKQVSASCNHAHGSIKGTVIPDSTCLTGRSSINSTMRDQIFASLL